MLVFNIIILISSTAGCTHLYCDVISVMSLSLSPIVSIILRSSVHAPPKFKMAIILATYFCQKKLLLLNSYDNFVYVAKFVAL